MPKPSPFQKDLNWSNVVSTQLLLLWWDIQCNVQLWWWYTDGTYDIIFDITYGWDSGQESIWCHQFRYLPESYWMCEWPQTGPTTHITMTWYSNLVSYTGYTTHITMTWYSNLVSYTGYTTHITMTWYSNLVSYTGYTTLIGQAWYPNTVTHRN